MRSRPGSRADGGQEGAVRRSGVRRSRVRALGRVEERRTVANRPAHDVARHQPMPCLTLGGAERGPPARGLEAEQPAGRSRDPDAPATIARVGDGDDPSGHGRRRAATGTARGVVGVPRIARRTAELGLGHAEDPELGAVGLAQEHDTGLAVAREELGVMVGHIVVQRPAREGARLVRQMAVHVLDQEWHAAERAVGQVTGRDLASGAVHAVHDGVERGVDLIGPGDGRLDQLGGRHLPRADQLGEIKGIVSGVLVMAHAFILAPTAGPKRGERALQPADIASLLTVLARRRLGDEPRTRSGGKAPGPRGLDPTSRPKRWKDGPSTPREPPERARGWSRTGAGGCGQGRKHRNGCEVRRAPALPPLADRRRQSPTRPFGPRSPRGSRIRSRSAARGGRHHAPPTAGPRPHGAPPARERHR